MVGRVRKVLTFQADGRTPWISGSMVSFKATQEVACVKLNTRLSSINIHGSAADRFVYFCGETQFSFFFLVKNIAMIITRTVLDLSIICINIFAYRLSYTEVERSSFHSSNFSCGDRGLVNGEIIIGVNLQVNVINSRCRVCSTC